MFIARLQINESLEAQEGVGIQGCYAAVVEVPVTRVRAATNAEKNGVAVSSGIYLSTAMFFN